MRRLGIGIFVLVATLAIVACGGGDDGQASFADDFTDVVGQELQTGASEGAPGQILRLVRVIIPAGEEVAPHTHPGAQLAFISQGTLTYTVIDGEVVVTRAADSGSSTQETFQSGDSLDLHPGDSIREPMGMVHMAKNEGDGPVVIYLSSLFPEGEPVSSPAQ